MSRSRPRLHETTPNRGATAAEIAAYLGLSETRFAALLPTLRQSGFPDPDPLIERYDRKAVDSWFDRRSGFSDSMARDASAVAKQRIAALRGA